MSQSRVLNYRISLELTFHINPIMCPSPILSIHQSHIPPTMRHFITESGTCMHIAVRNALWDICQTHCWICEVGLFDRLMGYHFTVWANLDWSLQLNVKLAKIILRRHQLTHPVSPGYYNMEVETKWPLFSRRYSQTHFLEWKCSNYDKYFTEYCSSRSNWL